MKNLIKIALSILIPVTAISQSDTPCGAPNINVNAACTNTTATIDGTANQQTNAANGGTPSCGSMGEDVWFSFTAPASGNVDLTTTAGTTTDGVMAVYSGACTSLTEVDCDDDGGTGSMPLLNLTGLTAGNTYYIRLWDYGGGTGNFDICLTEGVVVSAPANDDCAGAFPVTVNPDQACGSTTAGTVLGATASTQSTTDCFGTENDDVWFSFTATATQHTIDLLNVTGSTTDMYHSVWEGACPALTLVAGTCSDADNQTVTGLTIGNTYYVRVNTWSGTAGATSAFDICIGTPVILPPISNDDCGGAISLTVNPDDLCGTVTTATVAGATASPQSDTDCAGTENDDVWFTFVATSVTHSISLLNISGSTTDMYHSVWEGTCPALTLVAGTCSDPNNQTIGTLTIGNTYYVRVNTWSSTTGATSVFDICIGTPPPVVPPGSNSTCAAPDPICSGSAINFTSTVTGLDAEDDLNPGNDYDCLFSSPDPTWYYLEIAGAGNLVIDMTAGSDIDYAIWGPFADIATAVADCNSYGTPLDCSYSTAATEQANVPGTVVGEVYVLLVTNYAGTVQTITVADAATNTATTDCTIVPLPVELVNFDGHKLEEEIILSWTTISELNNDYFIIERSIDGNIWESIGIENGNGTTNATTNYGFIDRDFKSGTNYYRLKQFDFNGSIQFSDVIAIVANDDINVSLVPNPAKTNVAISTSEYFTQIDIINMQGRIVQSNNYDSIRKTVLDINDLEKGVYNINVHTEQGNKIERLIVL